MEGDTAPGDEPERSRVCQAAATERQGGKSELRPCEKIGDQVGTRFEVNSDYAWYPTGCDGKNDPSGQCDEAMDDEQRV